MSSLFTRSLIGGALLAATAASIGEETLGDVMSLKDEGMFFVGGDLINSDFPSAPAMGLPTPGHFVVNQMFVHYRIPVSSKHRRTLYPLIMVHGGGLTGMTWETTPDGREGWATYFTRKGFSTYVVDFPGRGRSGFNVTPLNQAKVEANPALQPSIGRTTAEGAWVAFRFGPSFGVEFPGQQFPIEALEQFSAQGVPSAEVTLTGGGLANIPKALAALLDKVGPAVVMGHSQFGVFADPMVAMRSSLIKGMIHVESNCATPLTPEQIAAYHDIPTVFIHGDFVHGNPAGTGQPRLDACTNHMNQINGAGGNSTLVELPDVGIHGNTHMLMQEKNNLEIADFIMRWIKDKVQ